MAALTRRFDTLGLLVPRVIVGALIALHGFQKLTTVGPAGFGRMALDSLGVPAPVLAGYVVTFVELGGGVLLILGLLTRLAALLLAINLAMAILLVKVKVGVISSMAAGAELDLAYIAAFLALLLMGPGAASLDRLIGLDRGHGPRRRSGEAATAS
ncbi:MAG: DoxX family protein [Actinomycetota bacterium]|jgi:putative oxidoreductase|nr:DoxX family protein [Actinomycetota bacterium]